MGKIKDLLQRNREALTLVLCLGLYCVIAMVLHLPCPILWITGVSCPGCGITRACLFLVQLNIGAAVYYNPAVFAVILAVVLLCISKKKKTKNAILLVTALVMIAVYLDRMLVIHAPVLQFDPANGAVGRLLRWLLNL